MRADLRRALGGGGGTAAGVPFAHAALPFLPFAWLATASVLGCNGGPCAQLARFYLEGADGRTARRLVVVACVEINQCVGCNKSFRGDDAAALAPSSGEEPASPRHRAGVASMAWRSTR